MTDQLKALKERNKQLEGQMEQLINDKSQVEGKMQTMAQLMTSLDLENETQKRHIQEVE